MDNIILVGYMACGKSSVKNTLNKLYNLEDYDTDSIIEKIQGLVISEIFKEKGEEYFRKLETSVIEKLLQNKNNCVIATGGGLPIHNIELLEKSKYVVYLKASKETILERVKRDKTRPLLAESSEDEEKLANKIETMLSERNPIYEQVADVVINVDNKRLESIAEEIMLGREKIDEDTSN